MPLPSEEANVTIRKLLANNWDSSNVTETFKTAWIGTGWWNEDTPNAQITVTGVSEPTEPNFLAMGSDGVGSWVDGTLDVNCWVPFDQETSYNSGEAKQFRHDLKREVHRIIESNQSGSGDLTRIVTNTIQNNPTDSPPPFRAQIEVLYQYRTAP